MLQDFGQNLCPELMLSDNLRWRERIYKTIEFKLLLAQNLIDLISPCDTRKYLRAYLLSPWNRVSLCNLIADSDRKDIKICGKCCIFLLVPKRMFIIVQQIAICLPASVVIEIEHLRSSTKQFTYLHCIACNVLLPHETIPRVVY